LKKHIFGGTRDTLQFFAQEKLQNYDLTASRPFKIAPYGELAEAHLTLTEIATRMPIRKQPSKKYGVL
jgi:hypothetical protein